MSPELSALLIAAVSIGFFTLFSGLTILTCGLMIEFPGL